MSSKQNRREFLKTSALGIAGAALFGATGCNGLGGATTERRGGSFGLLDDNPGTDAFHFAHLTDMHVYSKRKGAEGYRRCIETVNALEYRPDLVLMGGDLAFDGNYTPKDEFLRQMDLFKSISDGLAMPYRCALGNHDGFGWGSRRKTTPDDPDIGKKLMMNKLGMPASYYSFDFRGWHFVVLDSMLEIQASTGPTYQAALGKEQLEWLAADLGAHHGMPTICMTHIAAFHPGAVLSGDVEAKAISSNMMVKDARELRRILERHKVKAILQGHDHLGEQFCFKGVWYITSPAVSAAWWAGNYLGYDPGYTLFRCDGDRLTWEHRFYTLEFHLEPADEKERKSTADYAAELEKERLALQADIEAGRKLRAAKAGA